MTEQLESQLPAVRIPALARTMGCPVHALVNEAGPAARFAWDEFFAAQLRNVHTRKAYQKAVQRFLDWAVSKSVPLQHVEPGLVGQYFDQHAGSVPTKKLELAALRRFFDVLVTRHVLLLNPAASVRGERYQAVEGKTPEIAAKDARRLLDSIVPLTVADKRDRAVIGTLSFTAARVGAIAKLRRKHFYTDGVYYFLRFDEKGGRSREIPVRDELKQMLFDYLGTTGLIGASPESPLFRSVHWRSSAVTESAASAVDLCRMVKRRLKRAGISDRISPHSFRVCTITDLLEQGVPLEDVQHLAGHADPRTTRLYDRRQRRMTKNIVERISV